MPYQPKATPRSQSYAISKAKKERTSARVQVVVAMALDHLIGERIFYHQTQRKLLRGGIPHYLSDVIEPFHVWLSERNRIILKWVNVYSYSRIFHTLDFFEIWRPIIHEAIVKLNELPEIQELGQVEINKNGDIVLAKKSE